MTGGIIQKKLARLQRGGQPQVLDLFSGCGGLSLGFSAAGFGIAAGIESNLAAASSYGTNFHPDEPMHAVERDITSTTPGGLVQELKVGRPEDAFDVIIGGPPCQAYARVGRPKLRKLDEHSDAFYDNPRAMLHTWYIRYVKSCHPVAIMMENVPDVMNFAGRNIPEEICEVLDELGYVCAYTLLNAAFYGVPQTRERMFLIAYRREVAESVSFPEPSHWIDLPLGYKGSRKFALKLLLRRNMFAETHHYVDAPGATSALPPAVTAEEAIGDLPTINARELMRDGALRRGARRFDRLIPYDESRPVSDYARLMKTWAGFEAENGVYDHVIRYLPRDYPIFARLREGDQYPEAQKLALRILDEEMSILAQRGVCIGPRSVEYAKLKRSIVPPYSAKKFPNKWRKISQDKPVRTIMAHLSKDGYSHIHYDNDQARTISVREAARLQSFPDGFVFAGAMNQAFAQIGNAVPPLMAKAIAKQIMKTIRASATAHHAPPPDTGYSPRDRIRLEQRSA